MMRRRHGLFFTSVIFVLFVGAVRANASEAGGSAVGPEITELFRWINFAIVVGVVWWVFGKVLPPKFRSRAQTINSAISKAAAAKAEADRQLGEAQDKLARLQQEVAQLRAEAQRDGAAEGERIRQAAQGDAQRIAGAAKAEIEASERSARLQLKAIAAKLAVDGAESLLVQQLTPAAQESLVAAFVKSLDRRPN